MRPERASLIIGLYRFYVGEDDEILSKLGVTRQDILSLLSENDTSTLDERLNQRELALIVVESFARRKNAAPKAAE
jgi:hypothetical protein